MLTCTAERFVFPNEVTKSAKIVQLGICAGTVVLRNKGSSRADVSPY